jgi:hypothetical protein
MLESISKCREPIRSILDALDLWVTTTYPDTVVSETPSLDKEGWIDYAVPQSQGGAKTFAGARFRRDKPTSMTVVLAARPAHDPMEWVHAEMGRLRPLGFAFGLPRPFEKRVPEDEMKYVFDLIAQSRSAVID